MSGMYGFKYGDMKFSKDGSLDELIALDRYAVPTFEGYAVGDTVVAIYDKVKQQKRVAVIDRFVDRDTVEITDRFGEKHIVELELLHKPLETEPVQMWERWAKGGASVEDTVDKQLYWENKNRKLLDGFGYSLGGRIRLMLGQEYITGKKANLTAYNCFVARSPETIEDSYVDQFLDGLDVAYKEAGIMRRGGGVGINISTFATIKGSGATENDFIFYLDKDHPDYEELTQRIALGKLQGITIVTSIDEFFDLFSRDNQMIKVIDSVDNGLFDNMKDMARLSYCEQKVFLDFNDLRKRNSIVKGVNGRSSGAVSWMELFALIARLLQQEIIDCVDFAEIFSSIVHLIIQGGSRRGALMLICNVLNKCILKFIQRKREMGYLSGANISVGIDDIFMQRVKLAKADINLGIAEVDGTTLNIWNTLIKSAWESAEPGIVWLERCNKESNSWYFNPLICTNPCGEQPLPAWGVCNLGHHTLPRYYYPSGNMGLASNRKSDLYYPKYTELKGYALDWDELADNCHTAVRLQDNIISYTDYFLDENKETQLNERRVGIGTLGLGTLMIKMGLRYGSDEGNKFIDVLYKFIAYHTYSASMDISKEKGSFPAYDYDKFIQSGFMKRLLGEFSDLAVKLKNKGIRNVTLLTQAPTGSTGTEIDNIPLFNELFGGTTTGIEPYFAFSYWRASRLGFFEQTANIAKVYMEENELESIEDLPEFFVTAMDLKPEAHVTVQAHVQKWTDSSISKTANCPKDYTIEQTDELYMLSYDLGLKGMTIYRDGCREAQVLAVNKEDAKLEAHIEADKLASLQLLSDEIVQSVEDFVLQREEEEEDDLFEDEEDFEDGQPEIIEILAPIKKRPELLRGVTQKIKIPFGNNIVKAYITVNIDNDTDEPIEVFCQSNTPEFEQLASVIARTTTQFLRYGNTKDNVAQIAKHLRKGQTIGTFASRLAHLLESIAYGKIEIPKPQSVDGQINKPVKKKAIFQKCSDCGQEAFDKANCICTACGSSKCN